jgi:DNA-binding response OmpR family regulator
MGEANHTVPHRLLAVEDDSDCSDLIVRTALKCGYAALPALDARSMDETIRYWRPHVITLDLCLPEIDGMEVISLIKETGFAGPLVIISGQAEWIRDLTSRIASESGLKVPAHMSKPVDLRQLRELLTLIRAGLPAPSDTGEHCVDGETDNNVG